MDGVKRGLAIFILSYANFSLAVPYFGAKVSFLIITREPSPLNGYQLMLSYDPNLFKWHQFNLYFDAGFSYFHAREAPNYSTINIYSIAPILRYTFKIDCLTEPYLELSLGLSYLNHSRLADKNQGMHFAFQDRVGIGVLLGETKQLAIGLAMLHYSNAHLSCHNSGITVPLMLDVGYRFQ